MAGAPIGVSVLCPGMTNTGGDGGRAQPSGASSGSETPDRRRRSHAAFHPVGLHRTRPARSPTRSPAMVVDAIKNDRFWVISHSDLRPTIETRFAEILAAIPES